MDDFFGRISHPALTEIKIDSGGLNVSEVFPPRLPDLFVGRPVILTGRVQGKMSGVIRPYRNRTDSKCFYSDP